MMWELIAANRRKSAVLFAAMAALLCALGFVIGEVVSRDGGGVAGVVFALAVWAILATASLVGGSDLVLRIGRAHPVTPDVHPQLYNVVEEMKIAANLPVMPKIYVVDEKAPNAFATGLRPEKSAIAVTAGLLTRLNRDELQGVVAHEMSHIANRDVQFMTLAGVMLGSIVLLSQVFLRGMWLSPGSSRRYRPKSGAKAGGGNLPIVVVAIVLAILGPLFARLLYLAISRKREYLADASAVRLTRYPAGLADALEKISSGPDRLASANQVTAPMYIVNPLRAAGSAAAGLSSTHPPIEKRVAVLRGMSRGADLLNYQRSFSKVMGKATMIIPGSGLKQDKTVPIREAHPESAVGSEKKEARDVLDLMRAVNGFAFLVCACGLKIKVPPDFDEERIDCPRCGRANEIPKAEVSDLSAAAAVVGAMVGAGSAAADGGIPEASEPGDGGERGASAPPLEYRRRGEGWETFSCSCGQVMQLSPAFRGNQMRCGACGRITRIDSPA